jgi:solute carrier family 25 (adenine nucleotide translocator) protein 4/5/6/31
MASPAPKPVAAAPAAAKAAPKKEEEWSPLKFVTDFAIGGISGAVAKTMTAPIERVKLIIQTQDANPRIRSGEVPRYTGIVNCFSRVASEQGI